jgi:hypothetical protein
MLALGNAVQFYRFMGSENAIPFIILVPLEE